MALAPRFTSELSERSEYEDAIGRTRSATPTNSSRGSLSPNSMKPEEPIEGIMEWLQNIPMDMKPEEPIEGIMEWLQNIPMVDPRAPGLHGEAPKLRLADDEPVWIAYAGGEPVPPPPAPWVSEWQAVLSKGSLGHPLACGAACKYVRRKGGCKDGFDCEFCHRCKWSRKDGRGPRKPEPISPVNVELRHFGGSAGAGEAEASSVGAIGHPYSCAKACKYHSKGKGCKDGRFCVRCHSCIWRRCLE